MPIKVKSKQDIIDQFSFFDKKEGLYKLRFRAEGIVAKEVVENSSMEELALIFGKLLENIKVIMENKLRNKLVYYE